MTDNIYFFDSYALIEIILGNPNYKPYILSYIVTTKLNIFEVYNGLLRDVGKEEAEKFLEKYYQFVIDFNKEVIKKAAQLRINYKKRDISMTDCIGYVLAKILGIKFLTGDKEFKYFDNVEFIK
ncbi:MAG: PIN domain-containing protein [Nanoarchaeota archaeon]|nr:PIN domain-containing protein [Nanoarchaeota archaeon]